MNSIEKIIDKLYLLSIDHFVNWRRHLKEYFWAILIALTIRSFLLTIYRIPTGSMIPTLKIGDTLIANRFYYGLKLPFTEGLSGYRLPSIKDPEVGDIIVFRGNLEERHYILEIEPLTQKSKDILDDINRESSFERALSISATSGITNYIFLNQEIQAIQRIYIHNDIYKKYKNLLNDGKLFIIYTTEKLRPAGMTFKYNKNQGYERFLSTPIAGISILGSVLLNSPYFYLYKLAYVSLTTDKNDSISENMKNFSLYPNDYIDMTKDLVKRVIANEGDTLAISNNVIYVNGIQYKQEGFKKETYTDPNGYGPCKIGIETIRYHKNGKDITKKHSVRFYIQDQLSEMIINSYETIGDFNAEHWPYNAMSDGIISPANNNNGRLTPLRRDIYEYGNSRMFMKNFGPITIPKGHYFAMGDNRDNSADSRVFGCVPKWAIKGTLMFRVYPPNRFLIDK